MTCCRTSSASSPGTRTATSGASRTTSDAVEARTARFPLPEGRPGCEIVAELDEPLFQLRDELPVALRTAVASRRRGLVAAADARVHRQARYAALRAAA